MSARISKDKNPAEWERMWQALAELPENNGDTACENGEEMWQYMDTEYNFEDCQWVHVFRRRQHPAFDRRIYRWIPAQGITAEPPKLGCNHDLF